MCGNPHSSIDDLDWRGLVTDRWKYAFYETGHERLFDLETDPYEMTDLAADRTDVCRELRRRLLDMLAATREPFFDVLIEHGAPLEGAIYSVTPRPSHVVAPVWDRVIAPEAETEEVEPG